MDKTSCNAALALTTKYNVPCVLASNLNDAELDLPAGMKLITGDKTECFVMTAGVMVTEVKHHDISRLNYLAVHKTLSCWLVMGDIRLL